MRTGNELSWIYDDASGSIIKAEKDERAATATVISPFGRAPEEGRDARQEHVREAAPLTVNHALESVPRERKFAEFA